MPLGNTKSIYAGHACSPCATASNHRKSACNDDVCMRAINVAASVGIPRRSASSIKDDGTRLSWGFIGDLNLLLATSVSTLQAHCGKRVVALTPAHHSG
jgi:hypothetical protein